jgi:hypothetical protein
VDLEVTGANDTGVNDSTAIQAALDSIGGAGGGTLTLLGTCYVQTRLLVWSDTTITGTATVHRRITNGADIHATFRNKNLISTDHDIAINGLTILTDSSSFPGKQIVMNTVDGVTIEDIAFGAVHNTDAWLIFLRNVDNFTVSGLTGTAGTLATQAGVQCCGCRTGVIENIVDLAVGDDVIAIVNELYPSDPDPAPNESYDITIRNCSGLYSVEANILKVLVGTLCTATVHDITIENVEGKADHQGLIFYDHNVDQSVYNLTVSDVTLDSSDNDAEGFTVLSVRDSTFQNITVDEPSLHCRIDGAADCTFDLTVDSPRTADMQCILVADDFDCSNLAFNGGTLTGGKWGLFLGGDAGNADECTVANMTITGCSANGIVLFDATDCRIGASVFVTSCGDKAVLEIAPSDRNTVYENHLTPQDDTPADDGATIVGAASRAVTYAGGGFSSFTGAATRTYTEDDA